MTTADELRDREYIRAMALLTASEKLVRSSLARAAAILAGREPLPADPGQVIGA